MENINNKMYKAKVRWNGNHRFSGDWIYGSLVRIPKMKKYGMGNDLIIDNWVWAIQEYCPDNGLKYIYQTFEIFEQSICKYVGKADGVEIYEGDMINCWKYSSKEFEMNKVVELSNGMPYFGNYNWSEFKNIMRYVKVTGNKYDSIGREEE